MQFLPEMTIAEDLQVGRKDSGILVTQLAGDAVAVPLGFGRRRFNGLVEPFQLVLHRIARHEPTRDAKSLVVHDQRFAQGYARRNGDSL